MTDTPIADSTVGQWHRISPLTVWASAILTGALLGLPALVTAVILAATSVPLVWAGLTLLAGALLIGALVGGDVLRYRRTTYRLTDERMEVRSGVVSRAHLSQPRDRIRSVDLSTPVWTRPLGLCQVTVGTGQSTEAGGDELKLAYVTTTEGERLRRELLHQATTTTTPEASEEAPHTATTLATMSPAWFGYGVASPAPAAVAFSVIAATAGSLGEFAIRWILETYWGADVAPSAGAVTASLLSLVGGALVLGAVGALALHTEAWWNYRLTREPDGTLRVQRGLLNLSSVSIEERRLRGVEVNAFLPLRWFGAASVSAVASGLGSEGGGKNGQNSSLVPKRSLSPDVPRARAERIASAALPGATFGPLRAHPRAALRRRLVRAGAVVAGITAVALALTLVSSAESIAATGMPEVGLWAPAAVLLVTALVATWYARGCYHGLGHRLTSGHLVLRRGMTARSTAALNRDAVIGWTVRRSFFQRRAGLSTIGATIAADKGVFHAVDIDNSEGLALAEEAVPGLLTPFLERD